MVKESDARRAAHAVGALRDTVESRPGLDADRRELPSPDLNLCWPALW
jgi:hypothetical protein